MNPPPPTCRESRRISTCPRPPTHRSTSLSDGLAETYLWRILVAPAAKEDNEAARGSRRRADLAAEAATRANDANCFFLPLSRLRLWGCSQIRLGLFFLFYRPCSSLLILGLGSRVTMPFLLKKGENSSIHEFIIYIAKKMNS
jgi:hypothetical protein